jgi:ubiquitin carboxyl-terminal hydrolase 7
VKVGGYADAREYYDYLLNRIVVKFNPKPPSDPEQNNFDVVLSRKMSYDQFSAKVGERLGVNPTHIRFSTVNSATGKPKATVRRNPNQTLSQILFPQFGAYNANQRPDALYYEIMDMSLSELETKKSIKVTLVTDGLTKEVCFSGNMASHMLTEGQGDIRRPHCQKWHRAGCYLDAAKEGQPERRVCIEDPGL